LDDEDNGDEFLALHKNDGEYVNDDIHVNQTQPSHFWWFGMNCFVTFLNYIKKKDCNFLANEQCSEL
jgi:hypothetical protein